MKPNNAIAPFPRKPLRKDGALGRPDGEVKTVALLNKKPWPSIEMNADVHGKIVALVQECPIEIGWLSPCTRNSETFVIDDVFVPKQKCTLASTNITKDGEAEMLTELVGSGRASVINRLHCWGHSHVHMPVFASQVDERETDNFLAKRKEYFVRVIANKDGDLFASVYYIGTGIVVHHPQLKLSTPSVERWRQWAREEIERKVTQEVLTFDHEIIGELDAADLDPWSSFWLTPGFMDPTLRDYLRTRRGQKGEK